LLNGFFLGVFGITLSFSCLYGVNVLGISMLGLEGFKGKAERP
jgi:hypothetical protein